VRLFDESRTNHPTAQKEPDALCGMAQGRHCVHRAVKSGNRTRQRRSTTVHSCRHRRCTRLRDPGEGSGVTLEISRAQPHGLWSVVPLGPWHTLCFHLYINQQHRRRGPAARCLGEDDHARRTRASAWLSRGAALARQPAWSGPRHLASAGGGETRAISIRSQDKEVKDERKPGHFSVKTEQAGQKALRC
jgi:hypothetical protein